MDLLTLDRKISIMKYLLRYDMPCWMFLDSIYHVALRLPLLVDYPNYLETPCGLSPSPIHMRFYHDPPPESCCQICTAALVEAKLTRSAQTPASLVDSTNRNLSASASRQITKLGVDSQPTPLYHTLMQATNGQSIRQLALACGISPSHLSRILSGKRKPSLQVAARLAEHLSISVDKLIENLRS